jgi:hypothetical protein
MQALSCCIAFVWWLCIFFSCLLSMQRKTRCLLMAMQEKSANKHLITEVPLLKDFFLTNILPLAGPRPMRWTRDAVTKTLQVRDTYDIEELDPGRSKRRLHGNFAWKHGWKIGATSKGYIVKEKRTDVNWLVTEEPKQVWCRQSFNKYWSHNHPKLIVRKPSKDICSVCYKFSFCIKGKLIEDTVKLLIMGMILIVIAAMMRKAVTMMILMMMNLNKQ